MDKVDKLENESDLFEHKSKSTGNHNITKINEITPSQNNIIKRKYIPKETHEIIKGLDNEGNKVINQYTLLSELGSGSFSKVKLCIDIKTHIYYAAKMIRKKELAARRKGFKKDTEGKLIVDNYLKDALREIAILKKIDCQNIIQLREIIHDDEKEKIWLIMEFLEKGPILEFDEDTEKFGINRHFHLSDDERDIFYSEDELRDFLRGIVSGLDYCKLLMFLNFYYANFEINSALP